MPCLPLCSHHAARSSLSARSYLFLFGDVSLTAGRRMNLVVLAETVGTGVRQRQMIEAEAAASLCCRVTAACGRRRELRRPH